MRPDRVTPEVRAQVMRRDGYCFLYRLDRYHECRNVWGDPHDPRDWSKLTLDHVKDRPMLGRRAPSDVHHLVAMCWAGNVGVPSREVREAERAYLAMLDERPERSAA